MEKINFQISPFHYLDKKLMEEKILPKIEVDFTILLNERKKNYPEHLFIVTQNNQIQMIDSFLFNFIKADYDKKNFHFHIKETLPKNIYWIDIQSQQSSNVHLEVLNNVELTLIHEEVICEKSFKKSCNQLSINNKGNLNYYHLIHSLTEQLFHKENIFCNYKSLNLYFLQKEEKSKIKIDSKVKLFKDASLIVNNFILTQHLQLRDDFIEVEHEEENTNSISYYTALNNGKSVSQINNIINKTAINSELSQHIKHILLSETGQSFSKPSLMIHCPTIASHGNSIGSFPEEWLFYLMQKGINPSAAKDIIKKSIIHNFCSTTSYEQQFYDYFTNFEG